MYWFMAMRSLSRAARTASSCADGLPGEDAQRGERVLGFLQGI